MEAKERNRRMLWLTMDMLLKEAESEISCGCILEDDDDLLTKIVQDEPDTLGLRFSFGTITLFDDGTWKLEK